MIVIVIVGILSSVALPNFLSQTEKAKATEAKTAGSAAVKTITSVYLQDPAILGDAARGLAVKVGSGGLCPDNTTEFTHTCAQAADGEVTITSEILKGKLDGKNIFTKFTPSTGGRPEICTDDIQTGLPTCV